MVHGGWGVAITLSQSNAFLTIFKNYMLICQFIGFLGVSVVKNRLPMQETQVRSLGQGDPLEEEMATRSSILA